MKLYTSPASGNAYKCDLLLALLGVKHESIAVNLAANESRTEAFLAINPRAVGRFCVFCDTLNIGVMTWRVLIWQ